MARPTWTGMISFGLVNVPVKAYAAVRDHDVHFHQIDKKSGARVRTKRVAESTGREVEAENIAMGFEVSRGKYVTFDKDELEELKPASTKAVEIAHFVHLDEIDPIYYERTYWLAPGGDSAKKPYSLLVAAMNDAGRVGVGTVVMRNKQYLTAIRPLDGALAMSTMRFADEVVARADIEAIPARAPSTDPKMLKMAVQLIDGLTTEWKPSEFHDTYAEELRERIASRDAREPDATASDAAPSAKVLDLMAALEESVHAAKARRAPAKRAKRARKSA